MITIKPQGGLGNRMRVLASILELNRSIKKNIQITWECRRELNCPFEELFYIPEHCQINNKRRNRIDLFTEKFTRKIVKKDSFDLLLYDDEVTRIRKSGSFKRDLFKEHSVYIETCQNIAPYNNLSQHIKIRDSIYELARPVYKQFDPINTYGLHIRRTDNEKSKKFSPPELFLELISEIIKNNQNARFYLASDSPAVKQRFTSIFHKRIITYQEINLGRNSKEGVKHALAEMICLSMTNKIYGSYFSSFSSVAAQISNTEHEIIGTNTISS